MQSLAVLDALLCPEREFRCFSYDKNCGGDETMGAIRNGSGDNVFALFSDVGCFIKEFYHERPVIDAAYAQVPDELLEATQDLAFSPEKVTVCYWRRNQSSFWEMNGDDKQFDPTVSYLLAMVDGKPETYEAFAKDYHEQVLPADLVAQIFRHQVLTASNISSVSYSGKLDELKKEIEGIGYPHSLS